MFNKLLNFSLVVLLVISMVDTAQAQSKTRKELREERKQADLQKLQERFQWWPTDAKPGMVQDTERGGYWWWPKEPGEIRPWGNRGYIYVYKIIYDYKAPEPEDAPAIEPVSEMKPSLLIKKIIKNVKIYFDYNKADLRDDHMPILDKAIKSLQNNPEASILITGNCDQRGSNEYNLRLGKKRGEVVKEYILRGGIPEEKVLILSRGKLDAVAPVSDLVGMQKDRNAQFMVAEVEEVMIPSQDQASLQDAQQVEDGKYLVEQEEAVETAVQVTTREYVVQKGDTLSEIAQRELGAGHRWQYLFELNKDRLKSPNKLRVGQTIIIPVE